MFEKSRNLCSILRVRIELPPSITMHKTARCRLVCQRAKRMPRRDSALRNTHDRGHGRRAALSAPAADCKAAPRCTCCNNVPRLIHRRLSASSDSYDGRLCKTSRVHARTWLCVCVKAHARSASGLERQRKRRIVRIFPRASGYTADKKSWGETWRDRDKSVGSEHGGRLMELSAWLFWQSFLDLLLW